MNYRNEQNIKDIELISNELKTLPDYVDKFIKDISFTTEPKSRLGYVRDIRLFLEYVCQEYTESPCREPMDVSLDIISNLNLEFLTNFQHYLSTYQKNGIVRSNENVSICRKLSAIKGLYSFLYKSDLIKENLTQKIKTPKVPKKSIITMNNSETRRFLNEVENGNENLSEKSLSYHEKQKIRDITLMEVLLGTGMRVSECVGLNIEDIDFKECSFHIIRKGNKEDYVFFSDDIRNLLLDYLEYRESITPLAGHEKALFLSSQRKRIGVRTVEKLVEKYAKRIGTNKNITPHKLRSTFGTALYEETGDLYIVGAALGHENIQTTKDRYADMKKSQKAKYRDSVNWGNPEKI